MLSSALKPFRNPCLYLLYAPWSTFMQCSEENREKNKMWIAIKEKILETLRENDEIDTHFRLIVPNASASFHSNMQNNTSSKYAPTLLDYRPRTVYKSPPKTAFATSSRDPSKTEGESWLFEKPIVNLRDDKDLKNAGLVMVMFYAPWCPHCKRFKNILTTATKRMHMDGYNCEVGAINCDQHPELTDKYKIEKFPTIKIFRNGICIKEYAGKGSDDDLINFVKPFLNVFY